MVFPHVLDRAARRLGGVRVLALPLVRGLATMVGVIWVLVAPVDETWPATALVVAAFVVWSSGVIAALFARPAPVLSANKLVLIVDLAFALVLIHLTGGARSAIFLALLLIAALQSYYYGIRRGVGVGLVSAAGYLLVAWPTLGGLEWANIAVRLAMLLGAAVGVGILADLETAERLKVVALTEAASGRERFIHSVVESLRDGVVALDSDGRVRTWNAAMETRYGIPAAEVLGQNIFEFLPSLARETWAAGLRQLLRGEIEDFTVEGVEHDTLRKGRVILNLKGSLLRARGRPAGAVLLVEDITERVALERAARQSEKLAALGTMAAGLAHELNNPIGIITSRAELMLLEAESQAIPPEFREDLNVVHRHAQRVARITQGLLSFARKAPTEHGPVDLNRVVEETLLLIEKAIARQGIALKSVLAPAVPPVWGDANALQQVLMNLLSNARDALEDGGEIEVRTEPVAAPARGARLVVRDTGPGIPREVASRIFDPFFTTKPEGTGLGLSISYGIVRDHHGTVDVESSPGRGTTFVLTFPETGAGRPA